METAEAGKGGSCDTGGVVSVSAVVTGPLDGMGDPRDGEQATRIAERATAANTPRREHVGRLRAITFA